MTAFSPKGPNAIRHGSKSLPILVSLVSQKAMYLLDAESDSSSGPQEAMFEVVL